ncbi:E3 ubiquitin-protein ligase ATL42-like [Momordica charantia]|uniref:RING-type E3 ubiquitin transferase n=1 Tax=Momordica charantia TaxID=3673 RepID=A0A6J1CUV0_MOMCH|nr:E3 ubiquitin-protein ligase ATL42-like [Momordica charantia]
MSKFSRIILIITATLLVHANAQVSPPKADSGIPENLTMLIGIISIMLSLAFILVLYAKFCHRNSRGPRAHLGVGLLRSDLRFSGVDQKVIDSLPFFRFSSLKGSREGLECAVCLSKFEDIEVLRLLPKCKHAFHIGCVDHWLENHSSCPMCRCRISVEDVAFFTCSNSMRLMRNNSQSELPQDPNMELFVQREEDHHNSSRFNIGSSFGKIGKGSKEKDGARERQSEEHVVFHKHKHKILVSDFVFMNRWSNLSSSDLMFLNTEMLGAMSSNRFSSLDTDNIRRSETGETEDKRISNIKEEMEMKRSFETRISIAEKNTLISITGMPSISDSNASTSRTINLNERRSVSDTTAFSRFGNFNENAIRETSVIESNAEDYRIRKIWLPIARRTVQWFANREHRAQLSKYTQQPDV